MEHLPEGLLVAYLDGALTEDERRAVKHHLDVCEKCRTHLDVRQAASRRVEDALSTLAPAPLERANTGQALASMRHTIQQRNEKSMLKRLFENKTAQRWASAAAVVIVLIGLFALPPVQALASDFLGLFRVETFVVVDVDPERLEEISEALDEDMYLGEQEVIEQIDDPVSVDTLADAAAMVDFDLRAPQGYGGPAEIQVVDSGEVRYTPDLPAMRTAFQALGLDPSLLPESLDGQTFDITVPAMVGMVYDDGDPDSGEGDFMVMQSQSPSVDVPEDVDVEALGEAMLQLLGMSPREARRLSESIDWTTTLVLPIPTDVATVQEVDVDGVTGLLFVADKYDEGAQPSALLWQKNGVVTMISGPDSSVILMDIANSLQ